MWKHAVWVVVVTWYTADVSWLDELPFHHHLSLAVYVKQDGNSSRKCTDLPPLAKKHTALCVELPNTHGREAHTMAKFVKDNYHALPPVTFFAQDDCETRGPDRASTCPIFRLSHMNATEMADFTRSLSAQPFTDATCVCEPVVEDFYRRCPPGEIPPGHVKCYGDVWHAVESVRELAGVPHNGTLLRWPAGAHFAAPAHALRKPGRAFWATAEKLLDATGPDKREARGSLAYSTAEISKVWTSFEMAHVLERAWFQALS